jgi:hypothetical protein
MDFSKLPEGPVVKAFKDEGRREGLRKGLRKGRRRGMQTTLLRLLEKRGFSVSPEQKAKIESEMHEAVLSGWVDRVLDASSVDQVLGANP